MAAWYFQWNLSGKSMDGKIVKGEMLNRTQPTTLLQNFFGMIFFSKLLSKVSDDNFKGNSQALMG